MKKMVLCFRENPRIYMNLDSFVYKLTSDPSARKFRDQNRTREKWKLKEFRTRFSTSVAFTRIAGDSSRRGFSGRRRR